MCFPAGMPESGVSLRNVMVTSVHPQKLRASVKNVRFEKTPSVSLDDDPSMLKALIDC